MMFLVKLTHCRTCGWDDIIDEKEQCILRSQVNSFANEEVKLSNCWETSKYSKFMTDKVHYEVCEWHTQLFAKEVGDPVSLEQKISASHVYEVHSSTVIHDDHDCLCLFGNFLRLHISSAN